jgi:predicted alpha-1,2-mannosidase
MKYTSKVFAGLFLAALVLAAASSPARAGRLVDLVNPFITTGGDGFGVGSGYPGPAAPFGMIHPGPDTTDGDQAPPFYHCAGYYYKDKHIRAFSHTRIHGIGVTALSNLGIMPTRGNPADMVDEKNYRAAFSKKNEEAHPGYYSVLLDDTGIRAELTTGEMAAHHRYTFPAADDALVVINAGHVALGGEMYEVDLVVDEAKQDVSGSLRFKGGLTGGDPGLKIYFIITSRTPFKTAGTWVDDKFAAGAITAAGTTGGAVLSFNTNENEQLEFHVAISYISVEQARANLAADAPEWDFDGLRKRTEDQWESLLERIRVAGGSPKHQVIFYSGLYHSMLAPTLMSEAGGRYMGFDGKVHTADGFRFYSDMSLWDTFRTLHPLLVLLAPEYQRDFIVSMLAMAEQGGYLPKWPARLNYSNCMVSSPADSVIADSYLKGIMDFDVERAYEEMKEVAMGPTHDSRYGGREGIEDYMKYGYIPADLHSGSSVSETLEHAFHDFAIAQMAKALGKDDDYKFFMERSKTYKTLFNPETGFFDGRNSDGTFIKPGEATAWQDVYTEGTAWNWLWYAPQDVPGLIELLGGRDAFVERLDFFFQKSHREPDTMMPDKYYWHGNEPDIHAAYLYLWAGRPDRTQEEVRWILQKKYDDTPAGVDGNDDAGTLSSWFVFSSMGLFPIPAMSRYFIGSPIFEKSEIQLRNGNTFTVIANNVSPKNKYVQSATLNGAPLNVPYITHEAVAQGATLILELGPEPSKWAADADMD